MSTTCLTKSLRIAARQDPEPLVTVRGQRWPLYGDLVGRIARLVDVTQQLGLDYGVRMSILPINSDRYLKAKIVQHVAAERKSLMGVYTDAQVKHDYFAVIEKLIVLNYWNLFA